MPLGKVLIRPFGGPCQALIKGKVGALDQRLGGAPAVIGVGAHPRGVVLPEEINNISVKYYIKILNNIKYYIK